MKVLIVAVLSVLVLSILILSMPVMAEGLGSPTVLPGNPIYSVKIFFEKVRMVFTFGSDAKAKLHASLAEQRLAELNATIEKGKLQYVERLKTDYEKEINESEKILNRTEGLGRNATALTEFICNMTYKHISVLEGVWDKAPEQAKPIIERVINASIERQENCTERLLAIWNKTIGEVRKVNCTADVDCRKLVCPMAIGYDTPICDDGKCRCGGKWEIINKTEWKERFKEELTNQTQKVLEKIRQRYNETKIGERLKTPLK